MSLTKPRCFRKASYLSQLGTLQNLANTGDDVLVIDVDYEFTNGETIDFKGRLVR
ncbi:hypothetical protein SEEE4220_00535, partial [Salmonella enterica subsp. enterica serovar Enteritidis str. 543463 42-20]